MIFKLHMGLGDKLTAILCLFAASAAHARDGSIIVFDVSGSMSFDNKLELSRGSLDAFVRALGKDDRFDVMAFNVQAQPLFNQITPATDDARRRATDFLTAQQAKGGTALKPAVNAAYRYADPSRPLNVVILSDGLTDTQERMQLISLIRNRPKNARVFCIGVGNDVNRGLLEQLANDSGGLASFVSREDNFDRQAQAFRRKLTKPVATDVKISVDGVDAYDVEPLQLANLYHGTPLRLYGRYRKPGTAKITVAGRIMETPLSKAVEIPFPKDDPANPEIERMWAWHRVQRLLKEADAMGSRTPVVDEIIRLGEGYSIATEYTSFLVLENDAEFSRWRIERRNVQRLNRDRRSQDALATELEAIRAKAKPDLGPAALEAPKPALDPSAVASATPRPDAQAAPLAPAPAANGPANTPPRRQSRDLDTGRHGGGGSGAIDPLSAALVLALGALVVGSRRRQRAAA
jgi:Ca-activated chloride channel family protein